MMKISAPSARQSHVLLQNKKTVGFGKMDEDQQKICLHPIHPIYGLISDIGLHNDAERKRVDLVFNISDGPGESDTA